MAFYPTLKREINTRRTDMYLLMRIFSHEDLLKGIYNMKFAKPSKIQERALPLLLQNP
jgi:superfamily II DNA/RNA helicase